MPKEVKETTTTHTIVLGGNSVKNLTKMLEDRQIHPRHETITKATLVDGRKLDVSFLENTVHGNEPVTKKCKGPAHDDLIAAFASVNEHLARLTFQPLKEPNPLYDPKNEDVLVPEKICMVHCTGFSIKGGSDAEGVELTGYRTLPNAKTLPLDCELQKYNGDIYDYKYINDLAEAMMILVGEVELYMFPSEDWPECKFAPDPQLKMEFPEQQ